MATITNTVQGLNETVGLLKQILKAVNAGGESKGADAKDVASSSGMLSEVSEQDAEKLKVIISSLEPLDKMGDDVGGKAKNLAEALKILTSKEIIEGLKKYGGLSGKIGQNIAGIFVSIGQAFDKIDGGLNLGKIQKFAVVLNALTRALNRGVNVLYKLAGFVVVCALVGLIAIFAWKQILIGFVTIAAVALGIVALSYILSMISENSKDTSDAVKGVVNSVLSFALVVAICLIVGFVAQLAWPQILIGFITITATALGVVLLSYIISMVSSTTEATLANVSRVITIAFALALFVIVCVLVGWVAVNAWQLILIGFVTIVAIAVLMLFVVWGIGALVKVMNMGNFKDALATVMDVKFPIPESVKDALLVAFSLTLIPITCAIVGWITMNHFNYIMTGFGVLSVIIGALVLVLKVTAKASSQGKRVQVQIKSLIATLAAIVGVVWSIVLLAKMINEGSIPYKDIIVVVGVMTAMMIGFNLLIKMIGKMKVDKKGALTLLALIGMIALMIWMTKQIIEIAKGVQEVGGWGEMFKAIAGMAGIIVGFMAFAMVIGLLVSITVFGVPIVAIFLGIGIATVMSIAVMALTVGVAVKSIAEAVKMCNDAGISLDDLGTIGKKMGDGLVAFANNIINGLSSLSLWTVWKVGLMMKPISNMVNVCSKFLKMISSFSTEDCTEDELRPVFYNEANGTFDVAPKINVPNIGMAIGVGFANFARAVITGLEDLGLWATYKVGYMMKPISKMINTCSQFLKMISGFTTDGELDSTGENVIITPVYYNEEKGTFDVGKPIDVMAIGMTIANAFGAFAVSLSNRLKDIDFDDYDFGSMPDMITSVSKFVEMIADISEGSTDGKSINMYMRDGEGTYIKKGNKYVVKKVDVHQAGLNIAKGFATFIDTLFWEMDSETGRHNYFKKCMENGVGDILGVVEHFLTMISDYGTTNGDFITMYLKDKDGNYIRKGGKFITKSVNLKATGLIIANAFATFIDTLFWEMDSETGRHNYFKKCMENGVGDIVGVVNNFLLMLSAFEDNADGTVSILLRDNAGNYLFDSRGNVRRRNVNYSKAAFNIVTAFETFLSHISNGLSSVEGTDIKTFAESFKSITQSFESITRVITDITETTANKVKKNTEAINEFAESVGKLTDALLELKNVGKVDVGVNTKVNGKNDTGNGIDAIVDDVKKKTQQAQQANNSSIRDGIIEAFKKIHFEVSLSAGNGEIYPVSRGSGASNGTRKSISWSQS